MEKFIKNITSAYSELATVWLEQLPGLIEQLAEQWGLTELTPLPNLTWHYAMTGIQKNDGRAIVLKFSTGPKQRTEAPWPSGAEREATVLIALGQRCCPELLALDVKRGAILMERIRPANHLVTLFPDQESEIIAIVAELINRLRHERQGDLADFSPLEYKEFDALFSTKTLANDTNNLLCKAQAITTSLLASTQEKVLLHADLHLDNIIYSQERGWLAIDPKGKIGDPLYEASLFLSSPSSLLVAQADAENIMANRLNQLAILLCADRIRLAQWGFVRGVLGACWAQRHGDPTAHWLTMARILCALTA